MMAVMVQNLKEDQEGEVLEVHLQVLVIVGHLCGAVQEQLTTMRLVQIRNMEGVVVAAGRIRVIV